MYHSSFPHSNYGFDPLGLGKVRAAVSCSSMCAVPRGPSPPQHAPLLSQDPASLARFTEGEIINGRWAMFAVPGCLVPEALGYDNWYDAPKWVSIFPEEFGMSQVLAYLALTRGH